MKGLEFQEEELISHVEKERLFPEFQEPPFVSILEELLMLGQAIRILNSPEEMGSKGMKMKGQK